MTSDGAVIKENKYKVTVIDEGDKAFEGERLHLYYIPLDQAVLWEQNPKSHAMSDIISSIKKYGFGSPPKYDITLNDGRGGLVFGNGRTHALKWMRHSGDNPPKGILLNRENGEWGIPCLFGVDASSQTLAKQFAIDHNNITLAGGNMTHFDMSKLYDPDSYISVLDELVAEGNELVTVDFGDLTSLKNAIANGGDMSATVNVSVDGLKGDDKDDGGKESGAGSDDGSSSGETREKNDITKKWPTIRAKIRPDLYDLYKEITEDFGEDDDERIEGWLKQYDSAMKSVH